MLRIFTKQKIGILMLMSKNVLLCWFEIVALSNWFENRTEIPSGFFEEMNLLRWKEVSNRIEFFIHNSTDYFGELSSNFKSCFHFFSYLKRNILMLQLDLKDLNRNRQKRLILLLDLEVLARCSNAASMGKWMSLLRLWFEAIHVILALF